MTARRDRLDALLVDEATGSLSESERIELDQLLAEHSDVDRYAFERAAAAVFLAAAAPQDEPMPARLSAKLAAAARMRGAPD